VLAWWPAEQDWFYPGVVCDIVGDQADVQFDDGGRDDVPVRELYPLLMTEGWRVYGNWRAGGQYYPGRISKIVGHALHIDYDDGDTEVTSISLLRIHRDDF